MKYIDITDGNREIINSFIMKKWYSTKMILRGKE